MDQPRPTDHRGPEPRRRGRLRAFLDLVTHTEVIRSLEVIGLVLRKLLRLLAP